MPESSGDVGNAIGEQFLSVVGAILVFPCEGLDRANAVHIREQETRRRDVEEALDGRKRDHWERERRQSARNLAGNRHTSSAQVGCRHQPDGEQHHDQRAGEFGKVPFADEEQEKSADADGQRQEVRLTEVLGDEPEMLVEHAARPSDAE